MNNNKRSEVISALIYLASCELCGLTAELPDGLDPQEIFSAAVYHGIDALCASALSKAGLADGEMTAHLHYSIRKIMLLDAERKAISAELSREKIWHIPLKGVILKELYPGIGLRQMSDNDILFNEDGRDTVRRIFEDRGYTVSSFGGRTDDVYTKEPLYNYEMHVALFSELESKKFRDYFRSAYEKSLSADGSVYLRRMTDEDFYLYMKAHEHKHYCHGGTGLRSLIDTYVFLSAHGSSLNYGYLDEELAKLGISDYERESRELAMKILSPSGAAALLSGEISLSEGEAKMLSYLFSSGTYGTLENRVQNEMNKQNGPPSRLRYILSRLFPPLEWYRANAPFCYKHRILIPFYIVKRIFLKVVLAPGKAIKELSKVKKAKGNERNEQ